MALNMPCKTLSIASLCFALTAAPSQADMSMVRQSKQGGIVPGKGTSTVRIKGLKMRIDSTRDGENYVFIYDLESGKEYWLYPNRKEVSVRELKSSSDYMKGHLLPDKLRRVIKATGKKAEIGGVSCEEYTFDLQVPSAPSRGMSVVQHDSGTVCVSQTIPEGVEVTNFVHEAKKRGYTVAATALSPTQSPIGSYLYGPEPNVMVLAAKTESEVEGLGIMTTITNEVIVSDIKSGPIPDEDFQIPADWKLIRKSDFR